MSAKLSIDATKALVFCVVCISVTTLIALGKMDAEYLKYLLAWLIPGPISFEDKEKKELEK